MFSSIKTKRKVILIDDIGELVFSENIEENEKYEFLMTANHLYNAFKDKNIYEARIFFEKSIVFLSVIDDFLLFVFLKKGEYIPEYEINHLKMTIEKIIME